MKKFFITIFALLYLGLSCGFAFNIHFCMGKFSSVELFHNDKENCGKCGMKKMKKCCDSKLTVVKITDTQQSSNGSVTLTSPYPAIQVYKVYNPMVLFSNPVSTSFYSSSPPTPSGAFLCILNAVFII
ncbi:MAG: hypothetical protein M3R50_04940 [Bacteroidota bacterium]|nr:hypothetical protein [Bacteroidota bacterium]